MSLSKRWLLLTVSGVAAVVAALPASAQMHDRNRNVSVRERPQPGFDPLGVPIGAFRAYASAPLGVLYTDNVFALPEGQDEADTIFTIRPRGELRSQWSRHALSAAVEADHRTYDEFTSEDRTNVTLSGDGRIDIQRNWNVTGYANRGWLQEPRTDASAPLNTLEPVEYDSLATGLSTSKEFNRLRLSGGAYFSDLDYDDALLVDGVTVILQDDRDNEAIGYTARADYALTPTTAIFGSVGTSTRNYDLQPGDSLTDPVVFSRDSAGMTYSVGANFDITNLVRGEVSVGYLTEDFIDPTFSDIDGLATQARVEWFPTPLATFEFTAQRSVTETGVAGAAGALTTLLAARVDYELQRNIIVTGQLSHRDDEYEGVTRDDNGLAAALDVLYLVNEHVGASVSFQHAQRDSEGAVAGPEFDQESVGLNLVLRY